MNLSKWNFVSVVMLSLISTGIPASMPGSGQQQQKRHVPMSSANQSPNVPPYWEHILREFVYKTISQPPLDNINLYKRLLNAPFYGGPFAMPPNDVASVVLSRGDVYYLPNGHWLLCQEGCIDCEVCVEHTHPSLKWVLRRIKRTPVHGPPRQDLQLTVIPQIDGSYHMKNLWPRSYVYVTTQAEQTAYGNERVASYPGGGTGYENPEDGSAGQHRRSNNFWRFVERGSLAERRVIGEQNNGSDPRQHFESGPRQSHDVTVTTVTEGTTEGVTTFNSGIPPRVKPDRREVNDSTLTGSNENGRNRLKPLIPRLILGTDQLGQRHLVHVVPADAAGNRNLTRSVLSDGLNAAGVGQYQNRTAYQKILKRIYDSLSSNRRSIESFLETPSQIERRQTEDHQLQETRNSLAALRQLHSLHRDYNEGITNGTIAKRWPLVLTWNRQRRKSDDEANSNAIKSAQNPQSTDRIIKQTNSADPSDVT
ncbi:PREDICTED: uncharacterized protein LOC107193356 [Dufourea novaeangliae]|uniref:uncharacterized protein LOC107193356 n=1 Tax=Dufourea novaeangliae TaxID=178035 RepID=UPI0007672188|nr:PREDICTED: uncharacterized protein LOC107193356 [Dufourea novaeangliae]